MNLIELFSGTGTLSKIFRSYGHKCLTIDNNPDHEPDICTDILYLNVDDLPKQPDVIWASPPCTTFSVCTISKHWKASNPISSKCYIGLALVMKSLEIIEQLKPKYWFIENPRGMLRKQHFMPNGLRRTLTYCQYGEKYQKPTDIWTNAVHWISKKPCRNGDSCHEYQPRTYKSKIRHGVVGLGVQGLANNIERSKLPDKLCLEILEACEGKSPVVQTQLREVAESEA